MFQRDEKYLQQEELIRQRGLENEVHKVTEIAKETWKQSEIVKALKGAEEQKVTMLSHFILVLAIVTDIFGLFLGWVPYLGSLILWVFLTTLLFLFLVDSFGKGFIKNKGKKAIRRYSRKIVRIWILKLVFYSCEAFVPFVAILPLISIDAIIHIQFQKRGYYKAIEEAKEIVTKIKKIKL